MSVRKPVSTRGLDGSHPGNIPPSHDSKPHTARFHGMWSEFVRSKRNS